MHNSNVLLDHLLKVKSNGSMRWLACCPVDILRAIRNEILIVFFTAKTILNGEAISPVDNQRLLLATSRIEAALEAGGIENE